MADVEFDDFEGGYGTPYTQPRNPRTARWINIAGALTSVGLVIGMGVWGYKIAVRDVMGIPVVKALEGPMRIAPDNPGGDVTPHQGLSVNAVAAVGSASPTADTLILAPRPIELSLDDAPGLAPAMVETPVVAETAAVQPEADTAAPSADARPEALTNVAALPRAPSQNADLAPQEPAPMAPVTLDENTNVQALADALAAGATPLSAETPSEAPGVDSTASATDLAVQAALAEAPAVVSGGLGKSIIPAARPSTRPVLASTSATDAPVSSAKEIDAASLAVGTRLVQLGAFDDEAGARKEWDRLVGRFGELLVGKERVVQAAQSGGRTFYRLRAHGFDNEDDARRFCSALLAENAACIPVAIR